MGNGALGISALFHFCRLPSMAINVKWLFIWSLETSLAFDLMLFNLPILHHHHPKESSVLKFNPAAIMFVNVWERSVCMKSQFSFTLLLSFITLKWMRCKSSGFMSSPNKIKGKRRGQEVGRGKFISFKNPVMIDLFKFLDYSLQGKIIFFCFLESPQY